MIQQHNLIHTFKLLQILFTSGKQNLQNRNTYQKRLKMKKERQMPKDEDGRTFKWRKITEGLWEKVYIKVKKKRKYIKPTIKKSYSIFSFKTFSKLA